MSNRRDTKGDELKAKIPDDQGPIEKAASPIATASSNTDPYPHYIMAAFTGGGSLYAYTKLNNPRMAAINAACAAAYLYAARQLTSGNPTLGYDIGTVTSLALTAATSPQAMATKDTYHIALFGAGAVSSVANLVKSYEMRTGRPKEAHFEKK